MPSAICRNAEATRPAHLGGMDSDDGNAGDRFIKAIGLVCALGAVWLTVAVAYAAWLGLFG